MSKKKLFIFVFTIILASLRSFLFAEEKLLSDSENKIPPQIQFETQRYNFGKTNQGTKVQYPFLFTNVGAGDLVLYQLKTTCGCTAAIASTGPYHSGEKGAITVTYDSRGKVGFTTKEITVHSNDPKSPHSLTLEGVVNIDATHPEIKPGEVLFSGSCAECHSVPAKGKVGKELYDSVCHMCHDFPQESGKKWVAPNKLSLSKLSRRKLKKNISKGIPYTSMSAFSNEESGPLTDKQIDSLIDYLYTLR